MAKQPLSPQSASLTGAAGQPTSEHYQWLQQTDKLLAGTVSQSLLAAPDIPSARAVLGLSYGKQSIWVPSGAMKARTTGGASGPNNTETATNLVEVFGLDFANGVNQYAQIFVDMPKSWDLGTLSAIFWFEQGAAGAGSVTWGMQAVALASGAAVDQAFGAAQEVTTNGGTSGDVYVSAETAAMTAAGTPAADALVCFQFYRKGASDTLGVPVRLIGARIHYNTNAASDT